MYLASLALVTGMVVLNAPGTQAASEILTSCIAVKVGVAM